MSLSDHITNPLLSRMNSDTKKNMIQRYNYNKMELKNQLKLEMYFNLLQENAPPISSGLASIVFIQWCVLHNISSSNG